MKQQHCSQSSNRRSQLDRRQRPSTWWTSLRFHGRRRGARRAGEGHNTYVDRPTRRVTVLVYLITMFSVLDALFTLLYVNRGGGEANPLMDFAIQLGPTTFLLIKMGLTVLGVTMLALHQNFRAGLRGLYGISCLYILLLGYHGVLWLYHN